tara:strand:+ start:42 stop:650 length:609 start_codon:yes stop_codon:yes gene_type:complete
VDAHNDKLRKIDRYSIPMLKKLELRTSIYKEPSNLEEKTLLQLEQAKEVSDLGLQRTLLEKSALWLEEAANGESEDGGDGDGGLGLGLGSAESGDPNAADVDPTTERDSSGVFTLAELTDPTLAIAKGGGEVMAAPSPTLKRQTAIWADIVEMAWELRHVQLVQKCVVPILSNIWCPQNNREFIVTQVKSQVSERALMKTRI